VEAGQQLSGAAILFRNEVVMAKQNQVISPSIYSRRFTNLKAFPKRCSGAGWLLLLGCATGFGLTVATSGIALSDDSQASVTKTTAVAPSVPSKTRLAHVQLNDVTAVASRKGWLQEEFAKYNAKVDLVNTSSYGANGTVAALFDRGDLHISKSMMNGSLQNRVQGLDIAVIWVAETAVPRRATTFVLADTDIHTVADLKGKTLGSGLTLCPYYASVEALKAQGVTVDNEFRKGDLRYVNITGLTATSAFLARRFDAWAAHPAGTNTASLFIRGDVREVATAVPGGVYVTSGGRDVYSVYRKWGEQNPDLVKAFLLALDRTTRWLYANNGANLNEAVRIAAREMRNPISVETYLFKNESRTTFSWGEPDYKTSVLAIQKFLHHNVAENDPFFTKHPLSDKDVETFVDRRFFAGGEYFVDPSPKKL
jgi:sulfonate transport system substrate-binding protein